MAIEEFVIAQEFGENLEDVLSGVLVKSPIEAIKELVSNSYDADAQNVRIEIDEKNQTILVDDDGSGIDEKGLDDFMRMADSNKLINPISPKGRKRIGKFGIAKVLLGFLGDSYSLDTWCNGFHRSGIEKFRRKNRKGLEYIDEKSDRVTGTSILIRKARHVGTNQLSMNSLKRALTWEMPNKKDFSVFLNGERLVRKNSKPTKRYYFKEILPEAGKVDMEVDYFALIPAVSGIFMYVNGRSVGGIKTKDAPRIVARQLIKHMLASVNADGLQEHIAFNRAYIKEDNPAYAGVVEWVYENLKKVADESLYSPVDKKLKILPPIKSRVREILKDVPPLRPSGKTKDVNKHAGESNIFKVEQRIKSSSFKTHVVDKGIYSPPAIASPRTQELLINAGHPWYNSVETRDSEVLKAHLVLGAAFALGWEKFLQNGGSEKKMDEFYALCARLLSTEKSIEDIRERARETGIFSPFRRYQASAITREYVSVACLNELINTGVLNAYNGTFLGSELNGYLLESANCTPAIELVKEYEATRINPQTKETITRERARQKYSYINTILKRYESEIPFIVDIGKTKPFFLVQNEALTRFMGLYAQGALKIGVNMSEHMNRFRELFDKLCRENGEIDEFVGLEGLCEIARSSPYEVFRTISYAQKRGIELPCHEKDGAVRYSAVYFKKAREQFMAGGENA